MTKIRCWMSIMNFNYVLFIHNKDSACAGRTEKYEREMWGLPLFQLTILCFSEVLNLSHSESFSLEQLSVLVFLNCNTALFYTPLLTIRRQIAESDEPRQGIEGEEMLNRIDESGRWWSNWLQSKKTSDFNFLNPLFIYFWKFMAWEKDVDSVKFKTSSWWWEAFGQSGSGWLGSPWHGARSKLQLFRKNRDFFAIFNFITNGAHDDLAWIGSTRMKWDTGRPSMPAGKPDLGLSVDSSSQVIHLTSLDVRLLQSEKGSCSRGFLSCIWWVHC